ncbi:MAG: hypothetical protein Q7K98_02465 [Candidatus Omnitrophota bacterium]|nr:hypothetical protein [Candidatus Omnitrophota bacterium]
MDSKAKVIVLIIIILIALGAVGGVAYLYQQEHSRNIDLQSKLDELSTKQKLTEVKLLEAQKSLSALESKLKDATSQIDTLTSQLQQEKTSKEEALAKIDQMKADLDRQKELRSDLENKFSKAQDDVRAIQGKLGKIESEKATLEAKVKDLEAKSNVELGKIVVSPETVQVNPSTATAQVIKPVAPAQKLEGKVLVLNKEYDFAVINLGNKDGIAIGDQFSVYQDNKYLGDLKVEKVQDAMSAAGFLSDEMKKKIKEGDKVVKK